MSKITCVVQAVIDQSSREDGFVVKYFRDSQKKGDWETKMRGEFEELVALAGPNPLDSGTRTKAFACIKRLNGRYGTRCSDKDMEIAADAIVSEVSARGWWRGPAPNLQEAEEI